MRYGDGVWYIRVVVLSCVCVMVHALYKGVVMGCGDGAGVRT